MRLTRKIDSNKHIYDIKDFCFCDAIEKLGKLEDLEEEMGCSLEVREKTLNSFYCPKFENDKKLYTYYVYAFNNEELFIRLIYSQYDEYYNEETTVSLKDYKKTWALTKEELL